ncbi:hypothetical protein [Hahella ganghwensis]|uniref:hypothetical protein n=1 Tax=Hahella ganghwensis TaxID=286420 RepID=UPI00039A7E8F|nr:hypothetical protein [Hahella ganghwensis]
MNTELFYVLKPAILVVTIISLVGCVNGESVTKREYSKTIDKSITADFMYGEYPQLSSCFTEDKSSLKKSLDQALDNCRQNQLAKISDNEMLSVASQQNFTKRVTKCGLFDYLAKHQDTYKGKQDGSCSLVSRMYRNITQKNVDVF